jgi:hypothetical protein
VLPVLLMVLLGIVEFGRALVYWNDTTQIASVGARWAVVNRWPCTGASGCSLQDAIEREVAVQQGWDALADGITACVEFIDADGDGDAREVGDAVRVRTAFTFDWQFLPSWIDMADTTIRSSATMRLENIPTYAAGC